MDTRKANLTDAQWEQLAPLLPQRQYPRGAKVSIPRRELLNAILYIDRTGCGWNCSLTFFTIPKPL
jgi:transposase